MGKSRNRRRRANGNSRSLQSVRECTILSKIEDKHVLVTYSKTIIYPPKLPSEDLPCPPDIPPKYWNQRYYLFSKFDQGIELDHESWYSVTHELIANAIADRVKDANCVMDGFAGAGGNLIAFARHCKSIGIELNTERCTMIRNNSEIYNVQDRIQIVNGDFFQEAIKFAPVDVLFLSPPWGGPSYLQAQEYDINGMIPSIYDILKLCNSLTRNLILFLPRNINPKQIISLFQYLPNIERRLEFEVFYYGNKAKNVACYFGDIAGGDSVEAARILLQEFSDRIKVPNGLMGSMMVGEIIDEKGWNNALEDLGIDQKETIEHYEIQNFEKLHNSKRLKVRSRLTQLRKLIRHIRRCNI